MVLFSILIKYGGIIFIAILPLLIGLILLRPPDYDEGLADVSHIKNISQQDIDYTQPRYIEVLLKRVRANQRTIPIKIPIKWQDSAIRLTDDAFELFLIETVWGHYGQKATAYRWEESYLKNKKLQVVEPKK